MPSFLIRGLARYIAASAVAGSSGTTGFGADFDPDYATLAIDHGVRAWRKLMPWLLPFAQATGYRIVIDNPKSHQQIIIDEHTTSLPCLTARWLRRYDRREFRTARRESAQRIRTIKRDLTRGKARFGEAYSQPSAE